MRAIPRDTAVGLAPGAGAAVPGRAVRARPVRARLSRRLWLALAALAATGALAAGVVALTSTGTAARALPSGPVTIHGASLQAANCRTWWLASESERMTAIGALTRSIGGSTPYGPGTTLPAARVHRLFDTVCTPTFTSHFLLYEIYVRAAGFKSLGG